MKNIFRKFLVITGVLTLCLSLASFSTSLDGRAVVVDDGVFPQGLFAKTVGYLPGDIISVANISGETTVDILVIGALDPSEGVAIMLSPEAAKAVGINKDDNNIVKITKRSGQDERVYGSAIIAKQNSKDSLITELPNIQEESSEAFEDLAKKSEDEVQKTEIPAEKTLPFEESKEEIAFVPVEEKDFTSEESLAYNDETLSGNDEIAYEEVFLDEFDSPEASSDDSLRDYSEDFDEDFEQIAVREDDYEDDYEDDDGLEYEEIPFYVEALDNEDAFDGEDAFENTLEDALEDDKVPEEIAFADELEALQSEEEEFEEDFLPDLNENSGELVLAENLSPLEETFEPEEDDLDAVIDAELEDYDEALLAENDKNEDFAEEEIAMEEYEEDFEDEDEYSAIVLVPVDSILPDSSSDTNDYEEDFEDEEFIIKEIAEIPAEKDQIVSPLPLDVSTSISGKPDFSKYLVSSSGELKTGSYYIQIATYSADSSIQNVVDNYAKNYPITIVPLSMSKQVLIGPLNVDEYAVVLERFKSYGFENSFMRLVK